MATDAAQPLAALHHHAAPHGLDHHAVLVQDLEVEEGIRGGLEVGRAVLLDGGRAEDAFVAEVVPVHRRAVHPLPAPGGTGPEPFLGRLDDAQVLDRAGRDARHVRAAVHVGHVELPGPVLEVASTRDNGRARPPAQRHRVETALAFDVQQDLVAEDVEEIEAHPLALARRARAQEVLLAQRVGVLVLWIHALEYVEAIVLLAVSVVNQVDGAVGPSAHDGRAAVKGAAAVDDGEGAPGPVVARAEHAHHLLRAGDDARVEHAAGRPRIVAPVHRVVGAVRKDRPKPLGVAEVAVHVLPAVVEDAAVGREAAVPLEQRALTDLVDVGAVGLHAEQVAHDVAVAHAVLRLARRGERDGVIRQV